MLKNLLKWLGPWLLKQLIPVLDPDAAERAKALDAKIAAIEGRERDAQELQRKSDAAYAVSQRMFNESEARRQDLNRQRLAIEAEIEADEEKLRLSQTRRAEIKDELQKTISTIDNTSDADILSGSLASSRSGSG